MRDFSERYLPAHIDKLIEFNSKSEFPLIGADNTREILKKELEHLTDFADIVREIHPPRVQQYVK